MRVDSSASSPARSGGGGGGKGRWVANDPWWAQGWAACLDAACKARQCASMHTPPCPIPPSSLTLHLHRRLLVESGQQRAQRRPLRRLCEAGPHQQLVHAVQGQGAHPAWGHERAGEGQEARNLWALCRLQLMLARPPARSPLQMHRRTTQRSTAQHARLEAAATGDSAAEATGLPMGTMQASISWLSPCRQGRGTQVPAGGGSQARGNRRGDRRAHLALAGSTLWCRRRRPQPHLRALLRHHAPKVLAVVLAARLVVHALVNHVAGCGGREAGWRIEARITYMQEVSHP